MDANPTSASVVGPEVTLAFSAELARINLQRLFWLLIAGLVTRLLALAVNHYSTASSAVLAAMQWFDLILIPPLIGLTVWLRRRGASVRLGWMLILFVMWGTLGMAVIQAIISAGDLGYRAVYVYGVMIVGIAYVLPPRSILPAFAIVHVIYCTLVWTGNFDPRFKLASVTDGTLGVVFAAGVSWLLHRARWQDFLKERTIGAQADELARRNGELNELMAVVAHDVRSPLAGLKRTLEFAQELDGSPRLRQTLAAGAKGCEHLLAIAGRLLETHALEDRCREIATRPVDLRVAVAAAVDRIEPLATEKDVKLAAEVRVEAALAMGEPTALARVLDNLLVNAVRHSPAGGVVTMALAERDGRWTIDVSDEGAGVPEAERETIFRKFRRGRGESENTGSVGLGLFIAAKLTVAMNGRLSYVAEPERGAVFRIELVRAIESAAAR